MKIGIVGTRGIPNHYGGFEQFAEQLSLGLLEQGFEVWVYNSHNHPFQEKRWNGINLIHCYDPEDKIGTAGQFIYDFNCIRDSRKRNFDIVLQLGYTSNSIWHRFLPKKPIIITNMDGLEWKRSKYSRKVQRFLKHAEKLAVHSSDYLVADSEAIQQYLTSTYHVESTFIPYGAVLFKTPDSNALTGFDIEPHSYFLAIARMQSDNHVEEVIQGVLESKSELPLFMIGNINNKYGRYLKSRYADKQVRFLGSIYDQELLNQLRSHALGYFHGHSAGGTNPSLLEAMASSTTICAHNNVFNRSVLLDNALFFNTPSDIAQLINNNGFNENREVKIIGNKKRIEEVYDPQVIVNKYIDLFRRATKKK
ncbi:MAG: DUF1972 domain-containing protein [Salinivirgaceae bacterium]|nr:DUF1972 domain-containing protein [Salinivirgaceae bacterium]MDD4746737.1 DUF1972 domain-containing protein [Salinivirgaceae bacterium]MDY0281025.1 DUF1972 domain-containing protein [Salinivirgaceae bacterium]